LSHRLYKKEKLCGTLSVDALFDPAAKADGTVASALAYPVKMLWRHNPSRHNDVDVRFVITVPKRRLHRAVDRVTMRRRIREAYRLTRPTPPVGVAGTGNTMSRRLDVAFVYVGNNLEPYARVARAMKRLLNTLPRK